MTNLLSEAAYLREREAPQRGEAFYLHLSDLAEAIRAEARASAGARVLDFGCGGSPYREYLAAADYRRADFGASPGLDFTIAPDGSIDAPAATFDVVLSTQVLEHVAEPARYLGECHRLLRPGGVLMLSTHGTFEDHACPGDYRRWTAGGLHRDLEAAGFDVRAIRKLTTNGRAMAFLLRTRIGSMGPATRPPFGPLFWLVRAALRAFPRAFDRWCDRRFADCRVVPADAEGHAFYIGLLAVATKRA